MRRARLLVLAGTVATIIVAACSSFDGDPTPTPPGLEAGGGTDGHTNDLPDAPTGTDGPSIDACASFNVTSDPHNCGACGHDCVGGACTDGTCGVFRVAMAPLNVGSIAVTPSGVYWHENAGIDIRSCPPAGCPDGGALPFTKVPDKVTGMISVGAGLVLWGDGPLSAVTTPQALRTPLGTPPQPKSLVATGDESFVLINFPQGNSAVAQYTDGGIVPVPLPGGLSFTTVSAVGSQLFVYVNASPEKVLTCDLRDGGCATPRQLFGPPTDTRDGIGNTQLAAASDAVFVLQPDQQRLAKCAIEGCGVPSDLKLVQSMTSFAADARYVYFTTSSPGTVERCPHDGCGAEHVILAKDQSAPHALLVTQNAIYWATDVNGSTPPAIWRIAR